MIIFLSSTCRGYIIKEVRDKYMVALVCSTFKATLKPWGELQVVYEGQYLVSLVRGDVYRKKNCNKNIEGPKSIPIIRKLGETPFDMHLEFHLGGIELVI